MKLIFPTKLITGKLRQKWDKVFKNGPSEICGRQLLKNFTWSILEYFVQMSDWRCPGNNRFHIVTMCFLGAAIDYIYRYIVLLQIQLPISLQTNYRPSDYFRI